MGLFDKLKSLVSDDKKTLEPLRLLLRFPAKSSTLKMFRMLYSLRKSLVMALLSNQLATKW